MISVQPDPDPRLRPPGWQAVPWRRSLVLFRHIRQQPVHSTRTIENRGSLVMLTLNGATTYYLGPEGETGFEYDLARALPATCRQPAGSHCPAYH
jgi:hypothetical protein